MKKFTQIIVLLIISILLVSGCGKSPTLVTNNEVVLTEVLFVHNAERGKNGADQLQISPELMSSAQQWAETMAKRGRMVHGTTFMQPQFMSSGENIAYGQSTIDEVMTAWMNSTGHRKNILNKNFTHAGFGYARTSDGRPYWCAQFGQQKTE
jgi:uncharacterized protein YkwD